MNSVAFFQLTKQMQVPLVAVVEYFFIEDGLRDKILLLASMVLGSQSRVLMTSNLRVLGQSSHLLEVCDVNRGGFVFLVAANTQMGDVATLASDDVIMLQLFDVGRNRGRFFTTERCWRV